MHMSDTHRDSLRLLPASRPDLRHFRLDPRPAAMGTARPWRNPRG